MEGFLFSIGDVLQHKAEEDGPDKIKLFVVERLAHQCPGGVQRHYRCRVLGRSLSLELISFNELEVALWTKPKGIDWESFRRDIGRSCEAMRQSIQALTRFRNSPEGDTPDALHQAKDQAAPEAPGAAG